MERKIKHRILGLIVIMALAIILVTFLQQGKEPSETVAMKAPPFPDQSVEIPMPQNEPVDTQQVASLSPNDQAADMVSPPQQESNNNQQQTEDIISTVNPSVVSGNSIDKTQAVTENKTEQSQLVSQTENNQEEHLQEEVKAPVESKHVEKTKIPAVTKTALSQHRKTNGKSIHIAKARLPNVVNEKALDRNGLIKLKNAVWVIQMGSFKNKGNALRLVNQLRANGYRAFIQEVQTSSAEHTRVFVGPLNKQALARSLADRIDAEMHMRGIVISYQPLVL